MKFLDLSNYLDALENTSSRIKMTEILANLFTRSKSDEIEQVVNLILGQLAPAYRSKVFNVAEQMAGIAVSEAYSVALSDVRKIYKSKGDLGDVVFALSKKETSTIELNEVYKRLVEMADDDGEGSQERKIAKLANLLSDLDKLSSKFVVRIVLGKLRLGFSDKTILDALSWMSQGDKSISTKLKRAYEVMPDVGKLSKLVKEVGVEKAVENPTPQVFTPVLPMLAQRLKSPKEMIAKMGEVSVEPKFDGIRVLIHYNKKTSPRIAAFTRNLNNVSHMFPELEEIGKEINANEIILDSEAVGMDAEMAKMVDFQVTMQRRRKHDIGKTSTDIPLRFQVFDILYVDGVNLMGLPYSKRRQKLQKVISNKGPLLKVDEFSVTNDPETIRVLHDKWVNEGMEGIMVKRVDSSYIPGRTGWRWVKMKEEESSYAKLSDTVDAVVMGYTRGKGKRAQFGVGQFLVGVVDKDVIKTVSKVGTGLTDDQFRELNRRLSKITISKKPKEYSVHKDLLPDFWVSPDLVVEVAADEITKSPKHTAGLALRFPRLVKFRDDKSASEATTVEEIKAIFALQKNK